jgi:hypothetical protein
LADHAFSLVIHADPVSYGNARWLGSTPVIELTTNMPNIGALEKSRQQRSVEKQSKMKRLYG